MMPGPRLRQPSKRCVPSAPLSRVRSLRSPLRALDSDTLATQEGWLRLAQKSPENRRSDGTKTDPL
jgi:hypothetical protein